MQVLNTKNTGEIKAKNEGTVGSHMLPSFKQFLSGYFIGIFIIVYAKPYNKR